MSTILKRSALNQTNQVERYTVEALTADGELLTVCRTNDHDKAVAIRARYQIYVDTDFFGIQGARIVDEWA